MIIVIIVDLLLSICYDHSNYILISWKPNTWCDLQHVRYPPQTAPPIDLTSGAKVEVLFYSEIITFDCIITGRDYMCLYNYGTPLIH